MEYTESLQLVKPDPAEDYDVLQFNENADKITKRLNAALYEKSATAAGIHITDNTGATVRITNANASAVSALIDGIEVSIPAGSTIDYPAAGSGVTVGRDIIISARADLTVRWFISANDAANAVNIAYDNTASGLAANNVQGALDGLRNEMQDIRNSVPAGETRTIIPPAGVHSSYIMTTYNRQNEKVRSISFIFGGNGTFVGSEVNIISKGSQIEIAASGQNIIVTNNSTSIAILSLLRLSVGVDSNPAIV